MLKSVIITGASGFVGVNLKNYLDDEYSIKSLSIRYQPNQFIDLKGEAIVHLAGKAHDLKKVSNPKEYDDANFELTRQLFDAFVESSVSIFIFMSTVKAIADEVDNVLTENAKPNPKTPYGKSKLKAEEYILSKKTPEWKKVYILRPCMIHGPGNKGNLNLLYKLVSKGLPWPLGGFQNKRSFLSIKNLCFVIKEILENTTIQSGVFQIADDEPLSTNELIKLLGDSLNKKSTILNISPIRIRRIAKLGDYLHLPLNSERLQKLTENYVVSNAKIVAAIGKKLPVSSEEGLKNTFKSFRNKVVE